MTATALVFVGANSLTIHSRARWLDDVIPEHGLRFTAVVRPGGPSPLKSVTSVVIGDLAAVVIVQADPDGSDVLSRLRTILLDALPAVLRPADGPIELPLVSGAWMADLVSYSVSVLPPENPKLGGPVGPRGQPCVIKRPLK